MHVALAQAFLFLFVAALLMFLPVIGWFGAAILYVIACIKIIPAYFWLLETDDSRPLKPLFQGFSLLFIMGPPLSLFARTSDPNIATFLVLSFWLLQADLFFLIGRYCRKTFYRWLNYSVCMFLTTILFFTATGSSNAMWGYLPREVESVISILVSLGLIFMVFILPLFAAAILYLTYRRDYHFTEKELVEENQFYATTSPDEEK